MDTELEIEMFKFMISRNRCERFQWHVSSKKRRNKIFDDLRDIRYFDKSKVVEVSGPQDVLQFLKENKATNEIYIISSESEIDGEFVTVSIMAKNDFWASEEIIGFNEAARVGFFKNHEDWYYVIK
jgi:hypothetical protein